MQEILSLQQINDFLLTIITVIVIVVPLIIITIYYKFKNTLTFRLSVVLLGFTVNAILAVLFLQNVYVTSYNTYFEVLLATVVVELVIIGLIVKFLWKSIIAPLNELVQLNNRLADGDLTAELPNYSSKDEIGQIIESNNRMIIYMKNNIKEITDYSSKMFQMASEFATFSELLTKSSEDISSNTVQITERATKQSALSSTTAKSSETLQLQFEETIQSTIMSANAINSIADQVSMLSLNASIEAARAGEYGRGFTVVAENIRKLSDDSKNIVEKVHSAIETLYATLTNSIHDINISVSSISNLSQETLESVKSANQSTIAQNSSIENLAKGTSELIEYAAKLEAITNFYQIN